MDRRIQSDKLGRTNLADRKTNTLMPITCALYAAYIDAIFSFAAQAKAEVEADFGSRFGSKSGHKSESKVGV